MGESANLINLQVLPLVPALGGNQAYRKPRRFRKTQSTKFQLKLSDICLTVRNISLEYQFGVASAGLRAIEAYFYKERDVEKAWENYGGPETVGETPNTMGGNAPNNRASRNREPNESASFKS